MYHILIGPLIIALMRICDVSIGTFRTIMVIQGRKYLAGVIGFFEVLIWVFAIRFIFTQLDNIYNLFGYALGFALGNVLGITIEQRIGLGYIQLTIISKFKTDEIANALRRQKVGATLLPGEGITGGVAVIVCIIQRKNQKRIIELIDSIDHQAFINVQSSIPYRGFIQSARK
ncbi:MAG: DUF2179 domain-containing protein [Ignavibacteriaceae bacterium]|nr:DUF2179 domain-containing protein [Ignavibacteriaceae bacterium]